jgi:NADPH:quinone reductase-like Zn-dependent oxidoreductase
MKAVMYTEYGSPDVLKLHEIEKPIPKDNEVLIKIHATSVGFGDLMARNMKDITPSKFTMPMPLWLPMRFMFGFRKPKVNILGAEFSGQVETVGNNVTRFKAGDEVFGYLGASMGANTEYICMSEDDSITHKPTNMSYVEAASVPYGALMAVPLLKRVNIQPGQKVLINGASGSIGSCAVQLAKYYGAEVTGVCSTPRLDMVKALGADTVIDYTREDFTQNGETYDLIFDILGKGALSDCKNSLTENGCYLLASFKMKHLFHMLWTSKVGTKKVICGMSPEKIEDLIFAKELVEAGVIKSIIDRCYPLEQTADAHRYIETGQKHGEVIITVA